MWGQTGPVGNDFSGTYFIANHARGAYSSSNYADNFYLCPSTIMYAEDQPLLTTYKERSANPTNAKWTIKYATTENNVDYYYLIHSSNKYLTWHDPMTISDNGSSMDRVRLHLQSTLIESKALFYFTEGNKGDNDYNICLKGVNCSKNSVGSLNPAKDNVNDYQGIKSNWNNVGSFIDLIDGTTKRWCGGLVGIYEQNDPTGVWYLEEYITRPTISYNLENKILITPAQTGEGIIIKYTTDGKTPTSEYGETYSEPFDPPVNTVMIKAIAIVNGEESNVATFTPPVFLGSTHQYIIQSKNCKFYNMIPNVSVDNNTKYVSTLNVPCSTMAWHFEYADEGYYFIVDANGWYMYFTTTDNTNKYIYLKNSKDDSDGYKFQIASHANGGYNIIPKGQTKAIYKNNFGNNDAGLKPVMFDGTITNDVARWDLIPYSTTNLPMWEDQPFTVSTDEETYYYNIVSVSQPAKPLILNNSGLIKSEIVPTSDYDERKAMWVIKKVGQDIGGLLDYYTLQNAYTGDLLYYNGSGREKTTNASPGVLQKGMPEGADATWAHFVIVQTVSGYNIIPRVLVDNTKAITRNSTHEAFNCINRASGNDWTGTYYDNDNGSRWTFTKVDNVKCMEPVFTEEANGDITITTVTNAAKIRYSVDGADPTESSAEYTTKENTSVQKVIKAIAIIGDDINTASSIVALLNKPDVTLAGGPYTYKAADWEPSVTLSVGTTQTTTGFSTTYANQKNAGKANVTITDNEASDAWYIWNVPVTEFTIDKAPLTIKANDKSIGYGDEPDNAGVTYSGFVGSPAQTEDVLGGTLSYSYTTSGDDPHPYTPYDAQYGNQGTYVITPSGLTSTNYNITFISGTLNVTGKSIGDGSLASGFTLSFDESGEVILKYGTHTLTKNEDYTIGDEILGTKYSSKTISGTGNYTGSLAIRNAFVHFTTDANQVEWSATFVAERSGVNDIGHALPDGISAYIISAIEGDWAIPEPLDYIPADVPVLLVAHEEKNGFLVKDANSESVTVITDAQKGYNKLKEVTVESAHFNTKQIYVLYNNEFVLNKEGDLGRGKVYMENPYYSGAVSPAPARLIISRVKGNVTGIKDIQKYGTTELGNERWYTIDGRRLSGKPNAKGLYIVNGKKKVVK